ncbi:VWA domain-containing protein [Thiohalocapsa marina]|uniref:VWA domain-containing protein n=1 Tax=Thiohalocapsa marina TaxID=424902 RepID=UPI0014789224|nr:VWA domain-containing protein [Thiohalocapsa marina]
MTSASSSVTATSSPRWAGFATDTVQTKNSLGCAMLETSTMMSRARQASRHDAMTNAADENNSTGPSLSDARLQGLPRSFFSGLFSVLLLVSAGAVASPSMVQVSQVVAEQPRVVAYVAVRDEAGQAVEGIEPARMQATVGATVTSVSALTPFPNTSEGVAYLFAVDVSRSIVGERFEQMKTALRDWIQALKPEDQAGLITFGSSVQTQAALTADRDMLKTAVDALAPTDQQTQLHAALMRGLDLSQQRAEGLPVRRALVLLSDGLNDDPGGVSADEVLARMGEGSVPIYAIGFSAVLDRAQREAGLTALGRFARQSGGLLIDAGSGDPAAALHSARERIRVVYRAELDCSECTWDGNRYRVQVTLTGDGLTLSDGMDARLFPAPAAARPEPPSAETVPEAIEAESESAGSATDAPRDESPVAEGTAPDAAEPTEPADSVANWQRWWLPATGAGVALLLLLVLILVLRKRRRRASEAAQEAPASLEDAVPQTDQTAPETIRQPAPAPEDSPATARPTSVGQPPQPTQIVHLTGMSKLNRGQDYALALPPDAVLGRRPDCTLSLPQDDLVSGRHARLTLEGRRVLVADLGSTNQTFLNGVAVHAPHPLSDGDVLRIGQSEFRVRLTADSLV